MKRRTFLLILLFALAAPAQGLKLIVWDRELQTKLGYGESTGNKFSVQLVPNYSGPVVVLFSQTDEEKAKGSFPGLQSRYDGTLKAGQLTLQAPEQRMSTQTANAAAANTTLTLARFLSTFKLSVSGQPSGQTLSLPGLKSAGTDNK
ncbi:hypothetical protein [Deinococcus puniceus]|uniref:CHRD domain-containing protein n=1 Tax=Deinococcus puniceus TaxID=1182568 RepID=A0A172TCG2_9DEIO|nr:hypothetical protein [Deinococcus puniceus]ANE44646.1 hypothetical protein SU48_13745 [Deinococcus puniceus]